MIETYTHCATCKTDTRLGIEIHCVLCHANYPKGTQHTCKAIDEVVAEAIDPVIESEPSTILDRFAQPHICFGEGRERRFVPSRSLWPATEYHETAVPSGE